jgi:hypothetical protein
MAEVTFIGTCVGLRCEDLNDYDDSSRDIGYATFLKHVGKDLIRELERDFGYKRPLTLKSDWHISYSKGKWKGKPAVCMMHSSIHHIWTL